MNHKVTRAEHENYEELRADGGKQQKLLSQRTKQKAESPQENAVTRFVFNIVKGSNVKYVILRYN